VDEGREIIEGVDRVGVRRVWRPRSRARKDLGVWEFVGDVAMGVVVMAWGLGWGWAISGGRAATGGPPI